MTTELDLLSTAEAAGMTGIPEGTWRYWRHCGDEGPPSVRLGKRVFYRKQDIIDWINDQYEAEQQKRVSA